MLTLCLWTCFHTQFKGHEMETFETLSGFMRYMRQNSVGKTFSRQVSELWKLT